MSEQRAEQPPTETYDGWFIVRDDGEVMSGPWTLAEVIVKFGTYDATEYRMEVRNG